MNASGGASLSESQNKMGEDPLFESRRWIEGQEQRILQRWAEIKQRLHNPKHGRSPSAVTYNDVFPVNQQTNPLVQAYGGRWHSIKMSWSTDEHMSTILLNGQEVPAWLYGYLSHENKTCLPENGTADEIKDGIFAVLEESSAAVIQRVAMCLLDYEIKIVTSEVDLLGEHITIHCMTNRPVMEVNTIMGNRVVRKVMPSRAKVCVNTHVEQSRRTDDYLSDPPAKQEVLREFFYENGTIVRAEPQHWSAGSVYEPGDILRIGSVAMRVEGERNSPWANLAHDGDPVAGRDDPRRFKNGTPFQPGERAYWNAGRNR
jgi:hypothetical protein